MKLLRDVVPRVKEKAARTAISKRAAVKNVVVAAAAVKVAILVAAILCQALYNFKVLLYKQGLYILQKRIGR